MAQIKLSALLSDIRGKMGGSVFQGNNGILSLRTGYSGINKKSANQLLQRGNTKYLLGAWMSLTSAQQKKWNDFSALANIHSRNSSSNKLSGQSIFLKFNFFRIAVGKALMLVPTKIKNNALPVSYTLARLGNVLQIKASRILYDGGEFPFISISNPVSASVNYKSNSVRAMRGLFCNATTLNITSAYLKAWGFLPEIGDYVFIESYSCDAQTGWVTYNGSVKVQVTLASAYDFVTSKIQDIYSIEKCLSAYTGYAIQLYRPASGTFQDIGFIGNVLDNASVTAFANGQPVYVACLYSQLGNGHTMYSNNMATSPLFTIANGIETFFDSALVIGNAWGVTFGESKSCSFVYKYKASVFGYLGRHTNAEPCSSIYLQSLNSSSLYVNFNVKLPNSTYEITPPIITNVRTNVFNNVKLELIQNPTHTQVSTRCNSVSHEYTMVHQSNCYMAYFFYPPNANNAGFIGYFKTFAFYNTFLTSAEFDTII